MTGLQKDVLLVILKSQLQIEKARLTAWSRSDNHTTHYNACFEAIEEIERQVKHLEEQTNVGS